MYLRNPMFVADRKYMVDLGCKSRISVACSKQMLSRFCENTGIQSKMVLVTVYYIDIKDM